MTKDELIQSALRELEKLSPDDREIIYAHLGSRIHDALAPKIAEEAAQLWTSSEESGVEPKDWAREYLLVTIDLFHDQRTAFEMEQLRTEAAVFLDNLGSELRAVGVLHLRHVAAKTLGVPRGQARARRDRGRSRERRRPQGSHQEDFGGPDGCPYRRRRVYLFRGTATGQEQLIRVGIKSGRMLRMKDSS